MELRDLRVFVACVDLGSMTRAAERVHVVQSAVSQAVARLERSCGVALLERRHGGVRATEAGEALAVHAREMLNAMERAREDMHAFAGLEKGTIRLGILHTAIPIVLTWLLRAMRAAHPGLRLHVEEGTAAQLAEDLSTGKLDVAVLLLPAGPDFEAGPEPAGSRRSTGPSGLQVVTLTPVDLAIVAAGDEQILDGDLPLSALRDEEWVTFPPDNPGRQWLDRSCALAGFTPRVGAEVGTLAQLKDFVASGAGLGMIPAAAVELEQETGLLTATSFSPVSPVGLGYAYCLPQSGRAPSALRRLLEDHFSGGAIDGRR